MPSKLFAWLGINCQQNVRTHLILWYYTCGLIYMHIYYLLFVINNLIFLWKVFICIYMFDLVQHLHKVSFRSKKFLLHCGQLRQKTDLFTVLGRRKDLASCHYVPEPYKRIPNIFHPLSPSNKARRR